MINLYSITEKYYFLKGNTIDRIGLVKDDRILISELIQC